MSTNPAEAYAEKMRREKEANPMVFGRLEHNIIASEFVFHPGISISQRRGFTQG